MSERAPENRDDLSSELEGYELLDKFDRITLLRKTAFAVMSHANELRESNAMKYAQEHIPAWIGETVTDKRNVRVMLALGGAALAFMAIRKILDKEDWDEKISRGLQSITESIEREETTVAIEQDLGALGQPLAAQEIFEDIGSQMTIAGDAAAPGAFTTGVTWVRRALTRVVLPSRENPLAPPPQS